MEEITKKIHKNPKMAGQLLKSHEDIVNWCNYISLRIAFYFHTVMGFPVEIFKEKYESMNNAECILFCGEQVKKGHYII